MPDRLLRRTLGVAVLLSWAGAIPIAAEANLPQWTHTVALDDNVSQALRTSIAAAAPSQVEPFAFPEAAKRALIDNLPEDTGKACREMVEYWGTIAEGTARWEVRGLSLLRTEEGVDALVTLRCTSTAPEYEFSFDERAAVLRLQPGRAALEFIPLGEKTEPNTDLHHVEFAGSLPVGEGLLVELELDRAHENPCCDGESYTQSQRLAYVLLPEFRLVNVLEFSSFRSEHDDEAGDWERTCEGEKDYERDEEGFLSAIMVGSTCRTTGRLAGQPATMESRHYRWDAAQKLLVRVP